MELVIKAYGKFLLEAIIIALLFGMCFYGVTDGNGNRGVFRIIGAYIKEVQPPIDSVDFERYQSESEKSAPTIAYAGMGTLHTGSYEINSILEAADYRGQVLPISVKSICDADGIERIGEYLPGALQITFSGSGIYSLRVAATDAWNRTSICEFHIPVNH